METQNSQAGYMNPLLIPVIILVVAVLGLGGFGIWSFVNYTDQKNNVDTIVEAEVAKAKKAQSEEDEAKFAEREKQPTRQYIGPADLGSVQISFPKTWSSFVAKSGAGGVLDVYFHPASIPPLDGKTPFAARLTIEPKSFDQALSGYADLVKEGKLKSTPIAVQGNNGNRLDGNFTDTIQGSMVIFKVRDKTLRVFTEATTFRGDFDNIILQSLRFNP